MIATRWVRCDDEAVMIYQEASSTEAFSRCQAKSVRFCKASKEKKNLNNILHGKSSRIANCPFLSIALATYLSTLGRPRIILMDGTSIHTRFSRKIKTSRPSRIPPPLTLMMSPSSIEKIDLQ